MRTIGETSRETGVAQHVLRYWESRFPQLRPVQRAGNRRYYRPEDLTLIRRLDRLLNQPAVDDVNSSFVLRTVKAWRGLPLPN